MIRAPGLNRGFTLPLKKIRKALPSMRSIVRRLPAEGFFERHLGIPSPGISGVCFGARPLCPAPRPSGSPGAAPGAFPRQAKLAARHIRLGRLFVLLLTAGYFIGLGGMRFALGENLYQTAHSYFGTLALALLLGTAYLGRRLRLRPGDDDARQLHSYCAFLTIFLALVVAFLGFILLP